MRAPVRVHKINLDQRQSENHQLILKTGLATLGRLPIDQYDCERRGEEVGGGGRKCRVKGKGRGEKIL